MNEESLAKRLNDIFSDRRINTWTLASFTKRFFIPDTEAAARHWISVHDMIDNPKVGDSYIRQYPLFPRS